MSILKGETEAERLCNEAPKGHQRGEIPWLGAPYKRRAVEVTRTNEMLDMTCQMPDGLASLCHVVGLHTHMAGS